VRSPDLFVADVQNFPDPCKPINPYYHVSGLINQELLENNMVNVSFGGCLLARPEQNFVQS